MFEFRMRITIPWKKLTKDSSGNEYGVQNTSSEFHSNLVCVWDSICLSRHKLTISTNSSFALGNLQESSTKWLHFHILHKWSKFPFLRHTLFASSPTVFPAGPVRLVNHSQWNKDPWATVSLHSLWLAEIHCLDNTYRGGWTMTSWGRDTYLYT